MVCTPDSSPGRGACARLCAAALLVAPLAAAQQDPFPDDWYFSGAERPAEYRALEGQAAPEISIAEWRGDATTLADLRGNVVVVDFWATWCGPCMASIPENVELVTERGDDGLVFVGVHDSKNGWDKVDSVIADKGINYRIGKDDSGKSTTAYHLQFWPTYVVIDRKGIVRAVGLQPAHVKDAVERLLAEDPPPTEAPKASGFPDDWFYGGAKRSKALRAIEGSPAPALTAAQWLGDPVTPAATHRQVVVLQFVKPEFALSLMQLDTLAPVAKRYGDQGVTFVAVCDARSDWDAMKRAATSRKIAMPIAQDVALPKGKAGAGVIADALGVSFAPVTVVVDRAGTVRAAGLKTEHLADVLDRLLAEPMPSPSTDQKDKDDTKPRSQ